MHLHREVDTVVEQDFINVEVEDYLTIADRLDVRGAKAEMEVHVVIAGHGPVAAVLSEADRSPVGRLTSGASSEHRGFEPSRRQVGVDLLDGSSVDVIEGQERAAHKRVVDGKAVAIVIEIGKREENVVSCVMQEVEILGDIECEGIPADDRLRGHRHDLRSCKTS